MCGRFYLSTSGAEIASHFALLEVPVLAPRYNIAPGQPVPVVRVSHSRGGRVLEPRHWGLVPPWAEGPRGAHRMINARSESAAERPAFRTPLARRRGLVPADGFFEWMHRGRSSRPFAIHRRDGGLLALAALFERWRGPDDRVLDSCAILTTEANGAVRPIHDRMPVILRPQDFEAWLDPAQTDPEAILPLLRPCPDAELALHPVDPRVNDPRCDEPGLIEPERDLFSGAGA